MDESPEHCGSALGQKHWLLFGGQRWVVLLVAHRKLLAGSGLRSYGQRLSAPVRTLRWTKKEKQRGEKKEVFKSDVNPVLLYWTEITPWPEGVAIDVVWKCCELTEQVQEYYFT